jgi:aromatic ring-cleaving dioxygenase
MRTVRVHARKHDPQTWRLREAAGAVESLCVGLGRFKMADMSEPAAPIGTRIIRSFHAHLYFRTTEERERAMTLRDQIGERFVVQLGRVHFVPVGPHSAPMYQVAFARKLFDTFVPWLMLNRHGLPVLVHPNTGKSLDDHVVHALWLGEALPIRRQVLSNDSADDISAIEPNTKPVVSSD